MSKLQVGDIQLNYAVFGSGTPVLFIHGLGSSTRDWEFQVEAFASRFQVITIDLRGHGDSDKPPGPYSIPLFAKDTIALIQALGPEPVHVVGISLGGMVGFQLTVDAPDLVRSLVVVNSMPAMVVETLKQRLQLIQRLLIVRFMGMRKMGEVLSERLFPKPEHTSIREIFVERWSQNDPYAYRESLRAIAGWSVSDRLPEISCPVLVISSDADYTPVSTKEAYLEQIPNGELAVIEDSYHATPVDQPEAFNRVLMDFLLQQV
jgi:pimeloyl-ACP methyl ester carboxylesterase